MAPGRGRGRGRGRGLAGRVADSPPSHHIHDSPPHVPSSQDPISVASTSSTAVRGPTLSLALQKLTKGGKLLQINYKPRQKRPTGEYARLFAGELGYIVRTVVGPLVEAWKEVDKPTKQLLRVQISDSFAINWNQEGVFDAVMNHFSCLHRSWRGDNSEHFKSFENPDEARKNPPEDVSLEQWDILCVRYMTPQFKKKSEFASKSRKQVATPHTAGSRTFVRAQDELGIEDKIELYRENNMHKDPDPAKRTWISPEAEERYNKMKEMNDEKDTDGERLYTVEQLMEIVLGHRSGAVSGMGAGMVPERHVSIAVPSHEEVVELRERTSAAERRSEVLEQHLQQNTRELEQNKRELERNTQELAELRRLVMASQANMIQSTQ